MATARVMSLTAETLFTEHLLPFYPAGADLEVLRVEDTNPAGNPALYEHAHQLGAALCEFLPGADLDGSEQSISRLSAALTAQARDGWAAPAGSPPSDAPSVLARICMHGALYVASVLARHRGGAWLLRQPLWESRIALSNAAGQSEVAPLSWLLRALSDEEVGTDTLAKRYNAFVVNPGFDWENAPVWVQADRRLPKLAKVRYDALYKHLRAHLTELRDVGEAFPSPERFDAYQFKALEFMVLGGKQVLLYGLGTGGFHAFWMGPRGFLKSVHIACDDFPAPVLRDVGDKLELVVSYQGKAAAHQWLYWGP